SRFGDVARGVMLDQPPIFLGGQGGAVGPVSIGFGAIAPAGAVVRRDAPEGGRLLVPEVVAIPGDFQPGLYRRIGRVVRRNLEYIGDLHALKCWYDEVRRPFFAGSLEPLLEGALATLDRALEERVRRLKELAAKLERSIDLGLAAGLETLEMARQQELYFHREEVAARLAAASAREPGVADRDRFLRAVDDGRRRYGAAYRTVIPALPADDRAAGTRWLEAVAAAPRTAVADLLPSL
ncbi:MAG: UDP-N-acetylglucosamine pyrophosphorylase, partial [Planctomycetes bacterium]|nr:UDP-N-acetylglucosamine pyrophosphorylase [Planctomycetota bacterium]